jgi:hypothetical protein
MDTENNPLYRFYVLNRDVNLKMHYSASFMPRVGDTIRLAELCFKVIDVVLDTGNSGGEGSMHSITAHVEPSEPLPEIEDVEELDDFIRKSRTRLEHVMENRKSKKGGAKKRSTKKRSAK